MRFAEKDPEDSDVGTNDLQRVPYQIFRLIAGTACWIFFRRELVGGEVDRDVLSAFVFHQHGLLPDTLRGVRLNRHEAAGQQQSCDRRENAGRLVFHLKNHFGALARGGLCKGPGAAQAKQGKRPGQGVQVLHERKCHQSGI